MQGLGRRGRFEIASLGCSRPNAIRSSVLGQEAVLRLKPKLDVARDRVRALRERLGL